MRRRDGAHAADVHTSHVLEISPPEKAAGTPRQPPGVPLAAIQTRVSLDELPVGDAATRGGSMAPQQKSVKTPDRTHATVGICDAREVRVTEAPSLLALGLDGNGKNTERRQAVEERAGRGELEKGGNEETREHGLGEEMAPRHSQRRRRRATFKG